MKTRYFLLSAALVIATLLTGCTTEEILKLNNIQVSKSMVEIEMNGGSPTIQLTATGSWAIEAFDADWLTVSPTSGGAGNSTITFTAGPSAKDRAVELKLTCGNETQYIKVAQPGDPSLKPKYDEFKEGDYWIMFNNGGTWIALTPVPEGSSYGYLYSVEAKGTYPNLTSTAANAFTFKKVDGGFTMQDASGRYYYMTGTYTSCNVAAEKPADGAVWTVEQTGDQEFYIVNASNDKWMQFSTGYSSAGVYDSPQSGGLMPCLIEMGEPPVEPLVLKTDAAVDMPQGGGAFRTSFLCLGDGLEFSIPVDAQDWLGVVVSSIEADTTTVIVNVAENTGNNRSADITFSTNYKGESYTATVTVSQTGAITPATVGEVDAAPDDEAKLYRVQGYISSVNNLAKGRFNIKDYSGEIYAFNIAAEPGGSTDLSAILQEGDVVTIVGYKTSYQGKNELMGYLESYYHVEEVTIDKFLAAEDAADVFYRITGVVTNGAGTTPGGVNKKFDLVNYGNFDLVDETGSVYVYGVLTGLNGEKGKFGTLGVKEGDELTIVAAKKTFKDLVEADPTWYVSHTPADTPEPEPEPVVFLEESFAESQGAFTIDNVKMPEEGLEYVWSFDSKYGMKASAFLSGTAYETESWLISPSMDLSEVTSVTLTFDQAANKFAENAYKDQCKVVAICGEEKVEITIPEDKLLPGNSWSFVTTTLDLSSVASKSDVKVAFVYKSSAESCGTWEIKNVKVAETE
ncbi:MAG: choice-of-anchor J domain-containing protein [Bacteroidales bacterium]|nr:choice-of-anchor J domain-containing protein [Bacteroidales bacterium]